MAIHLVASKETPTNAGLLAAWRRLGVEAGLLRPPEVLWRVDPGDTVLARLDVRPSMIGVERGLGELWRLYRKGVRVLNPPLSLSMAHDKLATARALGSRGVPHPETVHVRDRYAPSPLPLPVVVKPRYGSWGMQVSLCSTPAEFAAALADLGAQAWWRKQGALVQTFVPCDGRDLRLLVACGEVVGAIERVAAAGEWRTNVSLGGSRAPVVPPPEAIAAAVAAAEAISGDVVAVDLLPTETGGFQVLEVNGAADFTPEYSLGRDVFDRVAELVAAAGPAIDQAVPGEGA